MSWRIIYAINITNATLPEESPNNLYRTALERLCFADTTIYTTDTTCKKAIAI
jgi:hypothetical protein